MNLLTDSDYECIGNDDGDDNMLTQQVEENRKTDKQMLGKAIDN